MTAAARAELYREATGAAFPVLIVIDHADLAAPIRLVNNPVQLSYGGNDYLPYPFSFVPPEEREDKVGEGRIVIDNSDLALQNVVRSLATPPTVQVVAMFWMDGGSPVFEPVTSWAFSLKNVQFTAGRIMGTLSYETRLGLSFPALRFTPSTARGVF